MRTPDQCLRRAIERGDRAKILMILNRQSVNLKALDVQGNTVLHHVLKNKHLVEGRMFKILKIFLGRGADPSIENRKKESVLSLAIQRRMTGVIKLLIKYNATIGRFDVTQPFIDHEIEEFWKCRGTDDDSNMRNRELMESKSASFFEFLLCAIDTINVYRVRAGRHVLSETIVCPLFFAVRKDLLHIVPIWLKYTKSKYFLEAGKTLLHALFQANKERPNSNIDVNWYTDYRRRYVPGIVKTLLDRGVSAVATDEQDMTPLRAAVENEEDLGIIEMLVNHIPDGCDESSWATRRFREVISARWSDSRIGRYLQILDELIARGADVDNQDKHGRRPVHRAVAARNLIAVKYLRGKGADLGVLTNDGDSLLHMLAEKDDGRVDREEIEETLFDWLASEGCQVNAKNVDRNSSLHVTVTCGNLRILRKLIDRGAMVDSRNREMQTPLHCAAKDKKAIDVAEFLINAGAKVNSRDVNGFTPLHLAATVPKRIDNMNMLKLLLNRGAYPDTRDNEGDSVLRKTMRDGNHSYSQELVEHGANVSSSRILTYALNLRSRDDGFLENYLSWHWLKMEMAKLPHPANYQKYCRFDGRNLPEVRQACLMEIETLKGTPIDSRTSLYQFLHMDPNSRRIHINNEKLKDLVDSSKLKEQFPEYAAVILTSYRETVMRKSILEPAKEFWLELTSIVLPDICMERIFSYLSNEQLVIFLEAIFVVVKGPPKE